MANENHQKKDKISDKYIMRSKKKESPKNKALMSN